MASSSNDIAKSTKDASSDDRVGSGTEDIEEAAEVEVGASAVQGHHQYSDAYSSDEESVDFEGGIGRGPQKPPVSGLSRDSKRPSRELGKKDEKKDEKKIEKEDKNTKK